MPGSSPVRRKASVPNSSFIRRTVFLSVLLVFFGVASLVADKDSSVRVSDALAATLGKTMPQPTAPTQSIVLQENAGTIVGQFATIDTQTDQGVEVRIAGREPKAAGDELLSIVGKY